MIITEAMCAKSMEEDSSKADDGYTFVRDLRNSLVQVPDVALIGARFGSNGFRSVIIPAVRSVIVW